MQSKKLYRIELTVNHGLAKDIAVMAALSNGSKYISITDIEMVAKADLIRYPSLSEGVKVTLSENTLLIDQTTGDKTINLLTITEVELSDLLDELSPSLNRYAGTGITDENNHEQLN